MAKKIWQCRHLKKPNTQNNNQITQEVNYEHKEILNDYKDNQNWQKIVLKEMQNCHNCPWNGAKWPRKAWIYNRATQNDKKKLSNDQQHYIKLHQINTICCKVWPKNKMPINRHKVTKRMCYWQNGNGMATKKWSSLQTEKWVCNIHN